jgi:hypothetical protein
MHEEDLTMEYLTGLNIITTASRQATAERRAAREAEVMRLTKLIARTEGRSKLEFISELLAFLGVILNTPGARRAWERQ